MCGITGFVGMSDEDLLRQMVRSMAHRGPDDQGFYEAPGVGLAMCRLSIIDLLTGHQPIPNETRDVWVVFNGELYNYQELTTDLKRRGHVFTTQTDTETIVHLYEDYDLHFVDHLRGMFGVALWDNRRQRLILARDRIGEKPLYYLEDHGKLIFGSELKTILQYQRHREVEPQTVCEFLVCGYAPAPRTFYKGIRKLPPGQMLVHENGVSRVHTYWQYGQQKPSTASFSTACDELSQMLTETTRLCLKSDVEVGAFLSGGIDSSVIVALMRKHEAAVQTFAVGYGGQVKGFNELHYARRVADLLGTQHHELILGAHSTAELLPHILWQFDEPLGEPTSILVYLLCEFTAQRLKVALGGTGGDEIFFGYPRYAGVHLLQYYHLLPRWVREQMIERIVLKWPESTRGSRFAKRAKRFVTAGATPESTYLGWISLLSREVRAALVSDKLKAQVPDPAGDAFLLKYLAGAEYHNLLERAAAIDVSAYLPEYQLTYMDRMSMAHSLEVRSPFCDYKLVDYVTALPAAYRIKRTHSKHILKTVARQWLPQDIVERRKVGFDSPIGQWIKDELQGFTRQFLAREHIERSGLLNYDAVNQVLGEHLAGKRDYSLQLWGILALEAWYRMYIEDGITDGREYALSDLRGAGAKAGPSHEASASSPSLAPQVTAASPPQLSNDLQATSSIDVDLMRRAARPSQGWIRRKLWQKTPLRVRRAVRNAIGLLPAPMLLGKPFRQQLDFIEAAQHWDADQARAYQIEQLMHICQWAYERSPFYREHFDTAGFEPRSLSSLEAFVALPTIDKNTLRDQLERMCTVSPRSTGVDFVSTGGTGGIPLNFYIGANRSAIEYAYLVSSWRRTGYDFEYPMAVLRGRPVHPDKQGLRHEYDPTLKFHYYSNFHTADEELLSYIEHIRTIGPCFLHVYPSSAAALARCLQRNNIAPPANIKAIIAESETVYPDQRELIEKVFKVRFFSCYGHSEKLVLGAECEHGSDYHIWPTYGYFELLNAEGQPITAHGQRGEIAGTGFINSVVPFIRYRTGDYAVYVSDHCSSCGRAHPIIRHVEGRWPAGDLVAADGSLISMSALNLHDETFMRVRQFQFRQTQPGRAELLLMPAKGYGEDDDQKIRRSMEIRLAGKIQLSVTRTENIPLTPRGKAVYLDQGIPIEQITQLASRESIAKL